jgi:hypothetical protein
LSYLIHTKNIIFLFEMDLIQINNSIEALKQLRLSVSNVFEVRNVEGALEIIGKLKEIFNFRQRFLFRIRSRTRLFFFKNYKML